MKYLSLHTFIGKVIMFKRTKEYTKKLFSRVVAYLKRLSPKTGIIILSFCILFYIILFAQMALPTSTSTKWFIGLIFLGLAKTAQYTGFTILGVSSIKNLKNYIKERKNCKK